MSSKILNLIRIFLVNEVYGSLLACGDSNDKEELPTLHIVKDRIIILYCWR